MNANQRLEEKEKALQNVSPINSLFLFSSPSPCLGDGTKIGQGGGGGAGEEDATIGERVGADADQLGDGHGQPGGEGEGAAERKSQSMPKNAHFLRVFGLTKTIWD